MNRKERKAARRKWYENHFKEDLFNDRIWLIMVETYGLFLGAALGCAALAAFASKIGDGLVRWVGYQSALIFALLAVCTIVSLTIWDHEWERYHGVLG